VTFKAAAGPVLKGLVCVKLCVASGSEQRIIILDWPSPLVRCNATHCPPLTGSRKIHARVAIPTTLLRHGQQRENDT